jgi:hypothetical protein
MIRWYDWVLAVFMANGMLTSFLYSITSDVWYISLIAAMAVFGSWDLWKVYCELRRKLELRK